MNLECRITEITSNPMHMCTLPVECYRQKNGQKSTGKVWEILLTTFVLIVLVFVLFMFALIKCKLICQNSQVDISLD